MNGFNFDIFRKFWAIAKLYWFGDEKKGALSLLVLLGILSLAYTFLGLMLNQQQGNLISSLSKNNPERFQQTVLIFLGILVVYVPLFASFSYCQNRLGIYWRRWLSYDFLKNYFTDRAFYKLGNFSEKIDNPDQRISEDIKSFTQDSLTFLLIFVVAILQIAGFSAQLWSISPKLVLFLSVYAVAGTLITTGFFGKKLVKVNFDQLKKEADFRFGLVRVRENAESIAFYQGEVQEANQLKRFFQEVFSNFNLLIIWRELYLGLFTNTYEFIPIILPALVVAPSVFSGEFEVGKVTEAQGAFMRVFMSLNVIVSKFTQLTAFAAGIDRLYDFSQYLKTSPTKSDSADYFVADRPTIQLIEENRLKIHDLTLKTPNYKKTLCQELSLEVPSGQGLLIVGASGCGKSSLLRAIAGLWNSGTGVIIRPPLEHILFLPQRPYMILGTLRNQLLYPHSDSTLEDRKLYEVLNVVNLSDLPNRFGGLDIEADWADVLSLGEQQRLAFARVLLTNPPYAILDEATSALDLKNEANLYQHLKKTRTTFISVGHRTSLNDYHHLMLRLSEGGKWQFDRIA
jgi:vitamin B12/bleomycin/antimicrobial peptide transport system ATP-binding/permease protein